MDGFPSTVKSDLRFYLDRDGNFTTQLRQHYEPLRPAPDERRLFVKVGVTWTMLPFDLLKKGMVFRVMDTNGLFCTWADDGSVDMLALDDPIKNREGVWGVRTRKPTAGEFAHV